MISREKSKRSKKKHKKKKKALSHTSRGSRQSRIKHKTDNWYKPPKNFCHGRFTFAEPLGKGGFAFVFAGWDNLKNEHCAIKVENKERKNASRSIKKEYRFSAKLHAAKCEVPRPIWCGRCEDRRVMVMQRLGDSLSDCFRLCGKRFSLQTTICVAIHLLKIIENVHNAGILHRDIKLQNFLVGYKSCTEFYVCDFGLSDYYINPQDLKHIPLTKGHSRYGTVRYASLNNHRGVEQSRRDDLESLGFVLLYAVRGNLPWQTIRDEDRRQKWSKVYEMKRRANLEHLCDGLPDVFVKYMEMVRSLEFEERPEYGELRAMFEKQYKKSKFKRETKYDWETAIE